jgi:hypothetical protein
MLLKVWVWDPVFEIRDPEKNLFRIPEPGVKKAPDLGSRIRNTALHLKTIFSFLLAKTLYQRGTASIHVNSAADFLPKYHKLIRIHEILSTSIAA